MGTPVSTESASSALPTPTGAGAIPATEAANRASSPARSTTASPVEYADSAAVWLSASATGTTGTFAWPAFAEAFAAAIATADTAAATAAAATAAAIATNASATGSTAGTATSSDYPTASATASASTASKSGAGLPCIASSPYQDPDRCGAFSSTGSLAGTKPRRGSGQATAACVCCTGALSRLSTPSAKPTPGGGFTHPSRRTTPRFSPAAATYTNAAAYCATASSASSTKRPVRGSARSPAICAL